MGVPDVAGVGVGTSYAVRVCVASAGSDWVGLDEDVAIASGVGVGISDWESHGVGVSVGVSVGGIYGVAVGASATACRAGVGVSVAGAAGLVHASTADMAANRATIAPAMATVIGFFLEAILSCLFPEFMTRRYYTTRELDDCRCHDAIAIGTRDGVNGWKGFGRRRVIAPSIA